MAKKSSDSISRYVVENASSLALRRRLYQAEDGSKVAKAIEAELAGRATTIVDDHDDECDCGGC